MYMMPNLQGSYKANKESKAQKMLFCANLSSGCCLIDRLKGARATVQHQIQFATEKKLCCAFFYFANHIIWHEHVLIISLNLEIQKSFPVNFFYQLQASNCKHAIFLFQSTWKVIWNPLSCFVFSKELSIMLKLK